MQGLESLNQFQNFMSSVGGLGRYEDTYMIHAAEGETVVPMEVLDRNPLLKERLFESMRDMGIEPERYIVGNEFNSLNPLTGQPEFFLKKIVQRLKKAAGDISGYAAPIAGAMYGPGVGAAVGAGLGAFKREQPGDPSQWAKMGMLGGASGVAANLAGGARGMDLLKGRGFGTEGITGSDLWKTGKKLWSGDPLDTESTGLWGATTGLLGKGWESLTTKKTLNEIALKKYGENYDQLSEHEREDVRSRFGGMFGDNALLKGLLGIGGTLGLGKLIGEPEDITIDPSRMRTAPIDTGQVFSPTQPTTVYKDYDIPIAAEGGIIGYQGGGFSGSPHGYGEMEGPYWNEPEGEPAIPGEPYGMQEMEFWRDFILKKQKESEDEENLRRLRELMEDPEFRKRMEEKMFGTQTMEARHGGIMDLQGGGFSQGPGTGTSDSIPAMLSDGEFVMTADAVRGAGGGNRREGARRMYEMMDGLEARA